MLLGRRDEIPRFHYSLIIQFLFSLFPPKYSRSALPVDALQQILENFPVVFFHFYVILYRLSRFLSYL